MVAGREDHCLSIQPGLAIEGYQQQAKGVECGQPRRDHGQEPGHKSPIGEGIGQDLVLAKESRKQGRP